MALAADSGERAAQKKYWEAVGATTVEGMMLDSRAKVIDAEERPEVLSSLPDVAGKVVLELGAGVGRFTGQLATKAAAVTAVDFLEDCIATNQVENSKFDNIKFVTSDVMDLEVDKSSVDAVFSNWLFMYLNDSEVLDLLRKADLWVRPQGFVFLRESCNGKSGDGKRPDVNPTHYRTQKQYEALFAEAGWTWEASGVVEAYIRLKNNANQRYWVLRRAIPAAGAATDADVPAKAETATTATATATAAMGAGGGAGATQGANAAAVAAAADEAPDTEEFQQFLDQGQYKRNGILRYERIFGDGYVSTGGQSTTTEFVARLGLKPGARVLDIGCGIGGGDFYMAREFGASVLGIDLSKNMIDLACERAAKEPGLDVSFEVMDVTTATFEAGTFDVVYTRDTLLHIPNKGPLFQRIFSWLKPGGRFFISDYARGFPKDGEVPAATLARHQTTFEEAVAKFETYVAGRGYDLMTPEQYGKLVASAGFSGDAGTVVAEDRTDLFVSSLRAELDRTEERRAAFEAEFSAEDYSYIVDGWRAKLVHTDVGLQRWAVVLATKAAAPAPKQQA